MQREGQRPGPVVMQVLVLSFHNWCVESVTLQRWRRDYSVDLGTVYSPKEQSCIYVGNGDWDTCERKIFWHSINKFAGCSDLWYSCLDASNTSSFVPTRRHGVVCN